MKPSPHQIEQAASALRDHVAARVLGGRAPRPWASLPETLKNQYRDEVKVVIASLDAE